MSIRKMPHVVPLLVLSLATPPAVAQEARWAAPDDPAVKQMTHAETLWMKANCGPQPELLSYFAEEFQGTTAGKRYGRDAVMPAGKDRDCQMGDVRIQLFGDTAAVSYGDESSVRTREDGTEWKRCLVWTDVWLNRDGHWQIITAQDVVVPCD